MTGRVVASVALLTGLACLVSHCTSAHAQEGAAAGPAPRALPKPPPEVEAWVKEVAAKMTDSNEVIRRSAVHALLAVGPDALPSLGKLAASDDAKTAATAMDLIAAIKTGGPGGRPRMPSPGMGPGPEAPPCPRCEGMGPMGMHDGRGPGPFPGQGGPPPFGGPRGPGGPGGPMGPGGPRGPMGPEGKHVMVDRILDEFGLEPSVRAKVDEVLKGIHESMRALHEKAMQGGMDHDAVRAEAEKLHAAGEASLKGLLTPEQLEKLKKVLGPRGPRPEQVPGGPGPGK